MTDATLFLVSEGEIADSFRLTEAGLGSPQYNDKIISDAIESRRGAYMVDWDNDKIDTKTGLADWQSICVAPAISDGVVKGLLYIGISAKVKEFTGDEMAFIQNVAIVVAGML